MITIVIFRLFITFIYFVIKIMPSLGKTRSGIRQTNQVLDLGKI